MKKTFCNIIYYGLSWCLIVLGVNNFCYGYTGQNLIEVISNRFVKEEMTVQFDEIYESKSLNETDTSIEQETAHVHHWMEGYEYIWIPSSDGRGRMEIRDTYACECGVKKEVRDE